MTLRPATAADQAFLVAMLALAADWRPGSMVRGSEAVLSAPELARYVDDWPRPGERGVVAEVAGSPVGAAWWRAFTSDAPAYGFVSADVPEVSVAVDAAHRGRGVGSGLMRGLVAAARAERLPGLSLSVEPDNPAHALYLRLGFLEVGAVGGAVTMLLELA